jgi:hypothetical protein
LEYRQRILIVSRPRNWQPAMRAWRDWMPGNSGKSGTLTRMLLVAREGIALAGTASITSPSGGA